MRTLAAPLRLRRHLGESARKVTWLELFFDLVFVAAVAQVAEPLHHHYSADGVIRFAMLFALIWWAWTGYTAFATRFGGTDWVQRGLTLVQMFVVATMAANAGDALDSRTSAGFAAAYAALRFVLVAQYIRARHLPDARPLTTRYVAGHGAAAALWLASAVVPVPWRYLVWLLALGVDLGTPWLALPHSARVPPDPEHLPERVGLFTLILFGEAVVAVMHGMESQEGWTPAAAAAAFLSMAWIFLIWWWYFDVASAASARVVRDRHDEVRFHLWTFAHFPFYLGYVVMAVGLRQVVTAADRTMLSGADTALMASATSLLMLSIAVIAATAGHRPRWESPRRAVVVLAAATGLAGFALPALDPVAAVALLLTACAGQIAFTSARQKRTPVTTATHAARPSNPMWAGPRS